MGGFEPPKPPLRTPLLFYSHYFVSLPVVQVKPKNNLPEAISACLGQALISNPVLELRSRGFYVQAYADDLAVLVTGADML